MDHQLLLIPSDTYSIDTSVILDIWCPKSVSVFSKHRIPELWSFIEKLINDGRIVASKEVYDELERNASKDLLVWLKAHKDVFVFDKEQLTTAEAIINEFYVKYKDGYKPEVGNAADPFVIALAMTNKSVVFTQEQTQGPNDPKNICTPKIPNVCSNYGVECVNILTFIDREGIKLTIK